jgi:two-component system sensor histidine kinase EvgS
MKPHSLLILLAFLFACIATNLSKAAELDLTLDERALLREHSVIRIGVDTEFAQFEFVDEEGNYQGISPQYLKLIGQRLRIEFAVVSGLTWKQIVEGAKNWIVDMVPVMQDTKERREFLNFTRPYGKG